MKKIFYLLLIFTFSFFVTEAQNLSTQTKNALVQRHNYYRSQVGSPDLQWSEDLAKAAQIWANKIAKKDVLMHSDYTYGENIAYFSDYTTPEEVVDLWASEKKYYKGGVVKPQAIHLYGHYTQIIWSATKYVGCAEAVSKKGYHYWVCEYSPAGNEINKKPVNK